MHKLFSFHFLIRIGLALVFLANSLTAFFTPQEFIKVIEGAFFAGILPVSAKTFVTVIGVNDALVAILLLCGVRLRLVATWASLWIIGVMVARAAPLEILEDVGFLAMAIALAYNTQTNSHES